MTTTTRRDFLQLGGLAMAAGVPLPRLFAGAAATRPGSGRGIPMIHATDLFHPHNDPDDHWDLASVYALAFGQHVDLKGVLIDYPPRPERDPDVMAVAQLNYYTGLVVPAVVGAPTPMNGRDDRQPGASAVDHQGVDWLLRELQASPEPVVVNIIGSANDVALATKKEPGVFREKCRGIYLNAGSAGTPKSDKLEWNVQLNPAAYAAIFDAPCPLYWLPCKNERDAMAVGTNGSYFRFLQGDVLPHLPARLQNFLLFMLGRKASSAWFSYLRGEPEQALLREFGMKYRNMWCTAGFLHAAELKVTVQGALVPLHAPDAPLFTFRPIQVQCDNLGVTTWKPDDSSRDRFILHIEDVAHYPKAMTLALKSLLEKLPA